MPSHKGNQSKIFLAKLKMDKQPTLQFLDHLRWTEPYNSTTAMEEYT